MRENLPIAGSALAVYSVLIILLLRGARWGSDRRRTGDDPERFGRAAYTGYVSSTGGRSAITGEPLPEWEEQAPGIRVAWCSAANAVRREIDR